MECNVGYAMDLLFSVTVSMGTKLAHLRRSVGMHVDSTLLHSRTFVLFVTELLCVHLVKGWQTVMMRQIS